MSLDFIAFSKVRNEASILKDTLDHVESLGVDGMVIYDDCSTDDTVAIAEAHPIVLAVVRGKRWDPHRFSAERDCRNAALRKAQEYDPQWLLCMDADERFEFPEDDSWKELGGLRMRLLDAYITPDDVDLPYTERTWFGPEYRDILMAYRNYKGLSFTRPDQREIILPGTSRSVQGGWVKHYGKAESVEQWESTCEYYATHFPEPYKSKWHARRGKAVKYDFKSDFGKDLIKWSDRELLSFRLQ